MKRTDRRLEQERAAMARDLAVIEEALGRAYEEFNSTLAPELIEASVYEINALYARYSYLLRQMKELGAETPAFNYPKKKAGESA